MKDDLDEVLKAYGIAGPPCSSWISPGWKPLVEGLIQELIAMGWDKDLQQVKQKFGGLRFYIGNGTTEMFTRIQEVEAESFRICEECGGKGDRTVVGGWISTHCEVHADTRGLQ